MAKCERRGRPRNPYRSKPLSFRVPEDVWESIDTLARREQRTKITVAIRLLRCGIATEAAAAQPVEARA